MALRLLRAAASVHELSFEQRKFCINKHAEEFLYGKDDGALEQVAQRGCGISLCGDIQGSSLPCSSLRSYKSEGRPEPAKQTLKKPKLPVGRFDEPEESSVEREPLEKFPDGINPATKERGGPKGPEPTRFGDWERKGRCIDF